MCIPYALTEKDALNFCLEGPTGCIKKNPGLDLSQNQQLLLTSTHSPKLHEVQRTVRIRHKYTCTHLTMLMMWGSRWRADIIIRDRQSTILLLLSWCFTSTETIQLIRDGNNEPGVSVFYIPYIERCFGLLLLKGLI